MVNKKKIDISVVVPVYSGELYLESLAEKINTTKSIWDQNSSTPFRLIELIFVEDSAIDGSRNVLKLIAEKYDWVRVIELSRNFGQHPATIAGILHSSGEWVVTMDEDLQHCPSKIELLLKTVCEYSSDLVYAKPKVDSNVHDSFLRDFGSKSIKKIVRRITGLKHVTKFNSFRLIRGDIARAAASICHRETFFDVALCWYTDKVATCEIQLNDVRFQETGESGYNFFLLAKHASRLIKTSDSKITRFGLVIGLVAFMFSILYIFYIILAKSFGWFGTDVQGWASIMVAITFFGSVSLLMVGACIEHLMVVKKHLHGEPTFFVVDRSSDDMLKQYFIE